MLKFLLLVLALTACASKPPAPAAPDWTHQASRMVDNGYIVYVGKGEAGRADDAQFKAEGLALEDLANECSLIPKGTRVEDRYLATEEHGYTSYTKIAVEFSSCDEASKANEPETIRKIANAQFTEQLKKYQDLEETGFRDDDSSEPLEPPTVAEAAPEQGSSPAHVHFYVTRQYVAYQKEIVVLSPPATYAPGSKEAILFRDNVVPASERVQEIAKQDPQLKTSPMAYHEVQGRPKLARPASLARHAQMSRQRREALQPRVLPAKRRSDSAKPQKKRRRKSWR